MTMHVKLFPVAVSAAILLSVSSFAQTVEPRSTKTVAEAQEVSKLPSNATSLDVVANEIGLLRKSVQTLTARLREISEQAVAPGANQSGSANDKQQNRIALNLEVLTRAEQRAEVLRKSLLELIEKEMSVKNRQVQIEEEIRPESIERSMTLVGSTRTVELRDVRRRVLENERKGFDSLLNQIGQSRLRLEDEVKQADALVFKIRQRLLPVIEKEIEKINPN